MRFVSSRVAVTALVAVFAASAPHFPAAWGQSFDIPLQVLSLGTGSSQEYRVGIDVGVGTGANGQPNPGKLYLFDTGSPGFQSAYSYTLNGTTSVVPWWPSSSQISPAVNGVSACYSSFCYQSNAVTVNNLTFYGTNSSGTLPAGQYQVNAITGKTSGGSPDPNYATLLSQGQAFEPGNPGTFYGTFGAGDFIDMAAVGTNSTTGAPTNGLTQSVLGQAQIPGTTGGYVVAVNTPGSGTPLNLNLPSTVTTGCVNPCTILGLTPALRAQFTSIVPWSSTYGTSTITYHNAANPGTPGNKASTEFGIPFNYQLSGVPNNTIGWNGPTLLDTGTENNNLNNAAVYNSPYETSSSSAVIQGNTLTLNAPGGQQTSFLVSNGTTPTLGQTNQVNVNNNTNADSLSPYNPVTGKPTNNVTNLSTDTVGISFFLANSVMFDLTNAAIGYTPFIVTDINIPTSLTVSPTTGFLGLAGVISDASASSPSSLTIAAGGGAQLSGANTYTGATTINPGTANCPNCGLFIVGPGSIQNSSGVVDNGGVFDISQATSPVAIRSITGSGNVYLGGQNLAITGANGTFSGVIADGGAILNNSAAVVNGGALPITGGSVTLSGGALTLAGANTYTGGTTVSAASLTIAASGSLASGVTVGTGGTVINNGTITGGLTDPAGAMTINHGRITGAVTIAAGSVLTNSGEIDGDLNDAGVLTGHGHHKGNVDLSGVITPSNAIGLTRVDKSFTFEKTAVYMPLLDGQMNADVLSVGGAINIKGGVVAVALAGNSTPMLGRVSTIMSSDSAGITGRFAGVSTPFPFLGAALIYTPAAVSVVLDHADGASFRAAAQTANQAAAGGALDALPNSSPLLQAAVLLNSPAAAPTLTALSGDIYGSTESVMQERGAAVRDAIGARLHQAISPDANPQVASLEPVALPVMPGSQVVVWQQALGAWGSFASAGNATGINSTAAGYLIGVDAPVFDGWRAGIASGFDQDWFNSTDTAAQASMTGAHLAGYAGRRWGSLGIEWAASNTWYNGSSTRSVALPGIVNSDTGSIGGTVTQVFGEANWDVPVAQIATGMIAEPFVDLAYAHVASDGLTESGGITALSVNASTLDDTYTTLGLRGSVPLRLGALPLKADGVAGWQHTFGSTMPGISLAFANGAAPFSTQGVPLARDTAIVGAGLRYDASPSLSFAIGYLGHIASGVQDNQVNGSLTFRF